MEMKHTGLFKMYPGAEIIDRDSMKYWMEKVECARSVPETKRVMKQFEAHRLYLINFH